MKRFWDYRIIFFTKAFSCLGVLLALWELAQFISCIEDFTDQYSRWKFFIGLIIALASIIYALCSLFYKKDTLELEINKRTKLIVEKGDLMTSSGVRVIPVNEYFDTHLGDSIVNPSSLHGQLLSKYNGRISQLRTEIDRELNSYTPLPPNRTRNKVPNLPSRRFPLGTCIRITDNGIHYILLALTRFNKDEHVETRWRN